MTKILMKYGQFTTKEKFQTFLVAIGACLVFYVWAEIFVFYFFNEITITISILLFLGCIVVSATSHLLYIRYI